VEIEEAPIFRSLLSSTEFLAPDTAIVNKPVTFEDTTSDAVSWEWRFGESDIVDNRSKKVSCTYKTPGVKTIYLKINGRSDRVSTRTIYVKNAEPLIRVDQPQATQTAGKSFGRVPRINDTPKVQPGFRTKLDTGNFTPPEVPKVYTDVQADEMIILIQGIVSGEKKVSDFSQYLCDGLNIPVTYNGTPMKFSQMCNLLKDFKKVTNISKPEVQLIKNSSTNCIKTMIVNVNKRSKLEKLFGKQK
jgi:PKD repeat protein